MNKRQTLHELAYNRTSSQVDRDAGIIRGVKVIGFISENGRQYPPEVLRAAMPFYEGVKVNIDHSGGDSQRSASDRFGKLCNVQMREDGIYADLEFLKSHPLAERVCEAAERMPGAYGLSHNADGQTEYRNGQTVVVKIFGVESVDLVADPATTKGLFEGKTMSKLKEEEMTPEAPAVSPEEALASGFKTAGYALIDALLSGEMDGKSGLGKLKELLKANDKLQGEDEPAAEPTAEAEGDEEKKDEPVAEAECDNPDKKEEAALTLLHNLVESLGRIPTKTELKALKILDAKERGELIESLKVTKAGPKTRAVTPVTTNTNGQPLWKDRKEFLESIRN